jgi:hypothetical protein
MQAEVRSDSRYIATGRRKEILEESMKKWLLVLALGIFAAGIAQAQTCVSSGLGSGSELLSTSVVTCGSLTFTDFTVTNPTGGASGLVDLLGGSQFMNGAAYLQLNPNLQGGGDEELSFTVTGGLTQIGLTVPGFNASVNETACANPIATSGPSAFVCTGPGGGSSVAPLATVASHSNAPGQPVFSSTFPSTNPVYVFKDIQTGAGGALSEFTEIFVPGGTSPTPEPGSLMLFGTGLIGLGGLMRKRMRTSAQQAA